MKVDNAFKRRIGHDWTLERLAQLSSQDVKQLRTNAEALGESELMAMCDEALKARPRAGGKQRAAAAPPKHARRLISRHKAFQARGVYLPEADSSWSGVRKSDGMVVMSLWAHAVVTSEGVCSQLLWGPNLDGSRPWSDKTAGKERRDHCKLALERGGAEGLLVHGEQHDGPAVEDNARSVYGVDPELVVLFQVEQRGDEYWAVWGGKADKRPQ